MYTRCSGENFKFTIGQGQVIRGWDRGVASMKRGEKAVLRCRSEYGAIKRTSPLRSLLSSLR
jgi:FKBP-type peptidyl-prolyl cis-trans isomerase